jgi:putative DNA primase/helicase
MLFSANVAPQINEDTDAVYRRMIVIPCNNKFEGSNCDPNILAKITTPMELSGLLNWALEGLKRLLKQGFFTNDQTAAKIKANYIRQSNSAKAFVEEKLEFVNDRRQYIPKLYEEFILFCKSEHLPTMPQRTVIATLKKMIPGVERAQRGSGKSRIWVYTNLKFKNKSSPKGKTTSNKSSTSNRHRRHHISTLGGKKVESRS